MTAQHEGGVAGHGCPVCGPLVDAARAASEAWEATQRSHRRGSPAYRLTFAAKRSAARALLASKRAHYATVSR